MVYESKARHQSSSALSRTKVASGAGNPRIATSLVTCNANANGGVNTTEGVRQNEVEQHGGGNNADDQQDGRKKKKLTPHELQEDLKNRMYTLYIVQRTAQPVIAKGGMCTFSGKYGMSKNGSRLVAFII